MAGKSGGLNWARRAGFIALFGISALSVPNASALAADGSYVEVADFVPQGMVSSLESIHVRFANPAVAFGDPDRKDPFLVECEGPAPKGRGTWLDDLRWTYVFEAAAPAGVGCVARADPAFRDPGGRAFPPDLQYEFNTGAPSVANVRPYPGGDIDEEQVFILQFNAAVSSNEVAALSHCVVEGVGEQIPVRAVSPPHLDELLEAAYMTEVDDPHRIALIQCARTLPPEANLRLEVGPGIKALGQAATLPGADSPYVLEYSVRPSFTANLSCTRERAGQPCLPITPIAVNFSVPVSLEVAKRVSLHDGDSTFEAAPLDNDMNVVSSVSFPGPFPPASSLILNLPEDLQDDAGRPLENQGSFPMPVQVGGYPPLAKFASGTFGVIERFANRPPTELDEANAAPDVPMVPVTIRNIEQTAALRAISRTSGSVAGLHSLDDREVLRWYARLQRLDGGRWSAAQLADIMADREPRQPDTARGQQDPSDERIDVRGFSALQGLQDVLRLDLPGQPLDGARPFEVIGIPVEQPGFHVLELESPRLGASLIEDGGPMYVRTGVLVTNLSVHAKRGSDDLFVWVTTLADATVVDGASVSVLDCRGNALATGLTDDRGIWHHRERIAAPDYCADTGLNGLFISARIAAEHPQAYGKADYAFVHSDWDRGIESWRFNVPTAWGSEPDVLTHTVLDRSLFRAGETVNMKHFLRTTHREGLEIPRKDRPTRLVIEHEGSAQRYELKVEWQDTPSGGLAAVTEFQLPVSARLGTYSLRLTDADQGWYGSTPFRVEEFRLPTFVGQLSVGGMEASRVLIAPDHLEMGMQLSWLSGGPAAGQEVALSGLVTEGTQYGRDDDGFSLQAPPHTLVQEFFGDADSNTRSDDAAGVPTIDAGSGEDDTGITSRLFLDSRKAVLDEHGAATIRIDEVPRVDRPSQFRLEASYADPVGEVQTLSRTVDVWPSAVQAAVKTEGWDKADRDIPVTLKALGPDLDSRPDVPMSLHVVERKLHTVRKRMVGGFYRYESHTSRIDMGKACEGRTGQNGELSCTVRFDRSGSFELVAVARDDQGRPSMAYTTLWVSGAGELWFGGEDDDRIDLVPAKKEWASGEEAEFQVRMPFRQTLALVSVEREGVLWTDLQHLEGSEPLVRVPVSSDWGPNAYVSVLLLRGRVYEPSVRSFLDGGWRNPAHWMKTLAETHDGALVSSRIDLAKPAFRMGLAELKVSGEHDRLKVEVIPSTDVLHIREEAVVKLRVALPDGRPASRGTVAFAAVDEALLELAPNDTWSLYEAMHPRRSLAVQTATTQLQVVGRRHYGRKAVAAGGGGGMMPTRELFDTLLSWQPLVQLDERGEAELRFSMNDALTRFRLVAVADYGTEYFGEGQSSVVTRQDMQIVSGLSALVREDDRYAAAITLRNGTDHEREIEAHARMESWTGVQMMPSVTVRLKPGEARTISWPVHVPHLDWPVETGALSWQFEAGDDQVRDRLQVTQEVVPRLPVTTIQSSMLSLQPGEAVSVALGAPASADRNSEGRAYGGIQIDVAAALAGSLEGVRDWWLRYPYTCLEQTASQALALGDAVRWERVSRQLGNYMDDDGLLRYFPSSGRGNAVLTAYVVAATHQASELGLPFEVPPVALERMLDGLESFAEGRIRGGLPTGVTGDEQRLMAMEALARHGRLRPEQLSSIKENVQDWSTPAVVHWLSISLGLSGPAGAQPTSQSASGTGNRSTGAASAAQATARNVLMARMLRSGTALTFTDQPINAAPALMATPVTSLAQLLSVVVDHPDWQDDVPYMAQGLLASQQRGAWQITTENLLAPLALSLYSRRFEPEQATGSVNAAIGSETSRVIALPEPGITNSALLEWPRADGELRLSHDGAGRAWVSLRAQARVQPAERAGAAYRISRHVEAIHRQVPGTWSPGDIYRVELEIDARDGATWVVVDDPVPAGATILGSGLGRDTATGALPTAGIHYPPAYVERHVAAWRAYYDYLPAGRITASYTVRLNAAGDFGLPPTKVEALYRPGWYGLLSNEPVVVQRLDTSGVDQ